MGEPQLDRLSPKDFEQLVGTLYETMGYAVQPTPFTADKGVDLYATLVSDTGTQYLAVQCKHSPEGTVGEQVARDMLGVMSANSRITQGVLVTSGRFSAGCKRFAEGKRMELVDRSRLLGLLLKYEVPIHTAQDRLGI